MTTMLERLANNLWLLQVSRDAETFWALKGRAPADGHGTLRLRGLDAPVRYRSGSTDIAVVWELFRGREYSFAGGWPFRTVVDCGANAGLFLAWLMRESGGQIDRYVGIEPDESSFEMLTQQAAGLGLGERALLVSAAVWDADTTVRFHDEGPSWGRSVREEGGREVRACTLPTLLKEAGLERVDLVKIDVEGAEDAVLRTLGLWADCVDAIVVELHGDFDDAWFAEQVRPHGFTPFPPGVLFKDHCGALRAGSALARRPLGRP